MPFLRIWLAVTPRVTCGRGGRALRTGRQASAHAVPQRLRAVAAGTAWQRLRAPGLGGSVYREDITHAMFSERAADRMGPACRRPATQSHRLAVLCPHRLLTRASSLLPEGRAAAREAADERHCCCCVAPNRGVLPCAWRPSTVVRPMQQAYQYRADTKRMLAALAEAAQAAGKQASSRPPSVRGATCEAQHQFTWRLQVQLHCICGALSSRAICVCTLVPLCRGPVQPHKPSK